MSFIKLPGVAPLAYPRRCVVPHETMGSINHITPSFLVAQFGFNFFSSILELQKWIIFKK
jgi:hypothetical protein